MMVIEMMKIDVMKRMAMMTLNIVSMTDDDEDLKCC